MISSFHFNKLNHKSVFYRCSPKDWQDKISKATMNTAIVPSLAIINDHTNNTKDNLEKSEDKEESSEANGLESGNFYRE